MGAPYLWYVPFGADDGQLLTPEVRLPGQIPPAAISPAQPFTIALQSVNLTRVRRQGLLQRVLNAHRNVLVVSTSGFGAQSTQRVHYYAQGLDRLRPVAAHDLRSNQVLACKSYDPAQQVFVELDVVDVSMAAQDMDTVLQSFEGLAAAAGAVYPALLPFVPLLKDLASALDALVDNRQRRFRYTILEPMIFERPGTPDAKVLQQGRYVVAVPDDDARRLEPRSLRLDEDGRLVGAGGQEVSEVSCAVLRVDARTYAEVAADAATQQAAGLLAELNRASHAGSTTSSLQTTLQGLTTALQGYESFTGLQQYQALRALDFHQLTAVQRAQLWALSQRPDLQPYIGTCPPPA